MRGDARRRSFCRAGGARLALATHAAALRANGLRLHDEVQAISLALKPQAILSDDCAWQDYVQQFGTTDCWELDALAPNVISGLVRAELESLIDRNAWAGAIVAEDDNRAWPPPPATGPWSSLR